MSNTINGMQCLKKVTLIMSGVYLLMQAMPISAASLTVDQANGNSPYSYNAAGESYTTLIVGDISYGEVHHTITSIVDITEELHLGENLLSEGVYNLSNGQLVANTEFIGYNGTGAMIQSAGSNQVNGALLVGVNANSRGTYTLNNGSVSSINMAVGKEGKGEFTQTGGSATINASLVLASQADSTGIYTINGGDLVADFEVIGSGGAGIFVQNGGTNTISAEMQMGYVSYASGTYILNGGTLSSSNMYIGIRGTGVFSQSGGTSSIDGSLVLALQDTTDGTCNLTGGDLNVASKIMSGSGSSKLNLDGGQLSVGGSIDVGEFTIGSSATGEFDSNNAVSAQTLTLGKEAGSDGSLSVDGGSVAVEVFIVGQNGAGHFNINDANASISVGTRFEIGSNSTFSAAPLSIIHMTGSDFVNYSTDATSLSGLNNLTMIFEGGSSAVDTFEVAGVDLGAVAEGFVENFTLDALILGGSDIGQIQLVDNIDNQLASNQNEALYVKNLVLNFGSLLDLNGLNLYYETLIDDGGTIILNGGGLFQVNTYAAVPEPASLVLVGVGVVTLLRRKR